MAVRLAGLLEEMQPATATIYLRCFLTTMRREWGMIDRLRLDKFLMLVRKFVYASFQRLAGAKW